MKIIYHRCREQAKRYGVSILAVFFDYIHARLRYGFCGEDYFLNTPGFALKNFQKKEIFSHREWIKIRKQLNNEDYAYILNDKVETLKYFSQFVNHEWCYPKEHSVELFTQFVNKCERIICKPVSDEGGKGVALFSESEVGYDELKSNGLLLEECIQQHPAMNLNNASVNTIRVYSLLDKQGKAHILKAILRAGVGDSVVDNYCSGGVIYPVNVEHGFIEGGGERHADNKKFMIHPGTDIVMLGFVIPHWDLMKETVCKMAESLPQIRYIGWDMVITPDGVDVIEANENAHHGFWERVGNERFFLKKIQSFV